MLMRRLFWIVPVLAAGTFTQTTPAHARAQGAEEVSGGVAVAREMVLTPVRFELKGRGRGSGKRGFDREIDFGRDFDRDDRESDREDKPRKPKPKPGPRGPGDD